MQTINRCHLAEVAQYYQNNGDDQNNGDLRSLTVKPQLGVVEDELDLEQLKGLMNPQSLLAEHQVKIKLWFLSNLNRRKASRKGIF